MCRRPGSSVRAASIALAALSLASSCGGDGAGDDDATMCVATLAEDCKPTFPPTFDYLYDNVLSMTCGSSGTQSACHYGPTEDKAQAGLVLSDPDVAYDLLLGNKGDRARVLRGDPECSILIERIESKDPSFRMPAGNKALDPGVRCAFRQWIDQGAKR